MVSAYTIDLSTGLLTSVGSGVATGSAPSVMLLVGNSLFIANTASDNLSTYTVNPNLSLTAGSSALPTGMTPLASMAKTTAIPSGVNRLRAAPERKTTGTNTMQIARVETNAGTAI